MIADLFADYMLAVFVVAGLIACTLLGLALGCQGLTMAVRGAHRAGQRARTAVRERDKARGERALALAQRDDAMRQLALAEAALERDTHPVRHSDDLPEQDPALDALVRAVTDPPVGAAPRGAHRRGPCGVLNPTDPALPECELPAGHLGTHVGDGDEWEESGPCLSITTDPYYAGAGSPELACDHEHGDGHDGRHHAHEGEVEWDDEGETWVWGELL